MNAPRMVLAPDSFKGSACAGAVARALRAGLAAALPTASIGCVPMADGGEGTLACIAACCPGRWQACNIEAIHGKRIRAPWYRCDDGRAIVESARVLGLPLVENTATPVSIHARGSHALGALLRAVLDTGARDIVIGLGGSACNDAGFGLLIALGAVARDASGQRVAPTLAGLLAVDTLSLAALDARLADTRITALADVDNPLLGDAGASRVYGAQKGLATADIEAVDAAFTRLAARCGATAQTRLAGSGAAGGLGFAAAVLGGAVAAGAQTLIEMTGLRDALAAADFAITGEGRADTQTLTGKLPVAVARAAAPAPTILVAGAIAPEARAALEHRFAACYALSEIAAGARPAARARPLRWLEAAGRRVGSDIAAGRVAPPGL